MRVQSAKPYNRNNVVRLPNGNRAVSADDLLREKERTAVNSIPLLAVVALTEDLPQHNLTRGQIGTVVEHLGWIPR